MLETGKKIRPLLVTRQAGVGGGGLAVEAWFS